MLAVQMLPQFEAEAKERMAAGGGDKKSGTAKVPDPVGLSQEEFRASMAGTDELLAEVDAAIDKLDDALGITAGESRDKAAAVVGVSPRMVSDAKAIEAEDPELAAAVATAHHAQLLAGLTRAAAVRHTSLVKAAARKAYSGASVSPALCTSNLLCKTERVAV